MSLRREDLEAAYDKLKNEGGRLSCDIDGWDAVTTAPPFLCVVCNTVSLRHSEHAVGKRSRCWWCWKEFASSETQSAYEEER